MTIELTDDGLLGRVVLARLLEEEFRTHCPAPDATVGRIPITDVHPCVDGGRRPARAIPGEAVEVSATIFREGHEDLAAHVVLTGPDGEQHSPVRMTETVSGTDRYTALIVADRVGEWTFRVDAWGDPIATWRRAASVKVPTGIDVDLTLEEGASLLERVALAPDVTGTPAQVLLADTAAALRDTGRPRAVRLAAALATGVTDVLDRHPLRELLTHGQKLSLRVDRERALYGAWYEFFPRSEGAALAADGPHVSGTFRTAARRLPAIAAMGFQVVYLPPIHPIGIRHRKGPGNTLTAGPYDPGSPWAIGSPAGGHEAIHPDLGTPEDFRHFVRTARDLGLEVALDFALQCSPDHPWLREHPDWFRRRVDGTVAYAENPPKKYQDIHPLDFDTDPDGIHKACAGVLRHWMGQGVRIFRVDNPHTKPVAFWERLLADIHRTDPDVVFLSEAFTRPAMLRTLARIGFHQSYTYFTWRNTGPEVESYLRELSGLDGEESAAYLRPNLFVNTPDMLPEYLQTGGRAAFAVRAVLAATASPSWGVYAGFELCEATPATPGTEEYARSEKYEYRPRGWAEAEADGRSIAPLITTLNRIREAHPALHHLRNLRFHHSDNEAILCFSKRLQIRDGDDMVLVVINLDPHQAHHATVRLDLAELGMPDEELSEVHDELGGATYRWGRENYVRLDPHQGQVAHIFTIRRLTRTSRTSR
ncbi:alpha-1,4-glucan--maltose-1-phosphate maltosyltransferase [Streptomyces sp. NPDC007095]|uniref:alpha-1,4-glucan--maltose-1-phosphate maltosyltransferase n=1 Tax=Streptomyces sp. NPDC007095 TaxID=3154482 RepID=UPI0033D919B4